MYTEPRDALITGDREMEAVIFKELRQQPRTLRVCHDLIEQDVAEPRGLRERRGEIRIGCGELLGYEAACEMIGS